MGIDPGPGGGAEGDEARGERLGSEAAFHDRVAGGGTRHSACRFYAVAASSKAAYCRRALELGAGQAVLEYGCGPGSCAFDLARLGARVAGVDISPAAIALARRRAAAEGLADRICFEVMDAESLRFADHSFALVCGSGILHHLDLERALAEVARVLSHDGTALFFEPLGHNPLLNLYRRLTPSMRTRHEHPLCSADLGRLAAHFGRVDLSYHHLASLAAAPLAGLPGFRLARALLGGLDAALLRVPVLRRQAWIVIAELAGPRRHSPGAAAP